MIKLQALQTASVLFSILLLAIGISAVLIKDYYTFSVTTFVAISGFLCLMKSPTFILLHCFSLVLLLGYGLLVAIVDALKSFDLLTWELQFNYISRLTGLLVGFMFTVGVLLLEWAGLYRDCRRIISKEGQFV